MRKKISLLLVFFMLFTMLPMPGFADGEPGYQNEEPGSVEGNGEVDPGTDPEAGDETGPGIEEEEQEEGKPEEEEEAKTVRAKSFEALVFEIDLSTEPVEYTVGEAAEPLTVSASVYGSDDDPTYQWYSNTEDSTDGGQALDGETEDSYTPSTSEVATTYYYVVAASNSDEETPTSVTSNIAEIKVIEKEIVDINEAVLNKQQEQITYYKLNKTWAPFTKLGVHALLRDTEQEDFEYPMPWSEYAKAHLISITAEAVAAIDSMAMGQNPRKYHKINNGILEENPTDLIGELLNLLKEDGTFPQTTTQGGSNVNSGSLYSILALEMFYGGQDWAKAGGNDKQTRAGAIGTLLEQFVDASFTHPTNANNSWEIEDGRFLGPTGTASTNMNNSVKISEEAVMLLSRWLDDDTLINVHGEEQILKDIALEEIEGMLVSFYNLFNNKGLSGRVEREYDNFRGAITNSNGLPGYISALIATDQKNLVDELDLIDSLLEMFVTEGGIENGDYNPNIKESDLGGYLHFTSAKPHIAASTVFRGTIALGDYLHNESIYKTLIYAPELGESETVSWDLEELNIPDSTMGKLDLPVLGRYGSTISWASSNETAINSDTGEVTRPSAGKDDMVVRLTATASYGEQSQSRDFIITVISLGRSDRAIANADANTLTLPLFATESIDLPNSGKEGSSITWVSSDSAVISENGEVNIAPEEKKVTLTATITYGEASIERDYPIVIGKDVDSEDIITQAVYQIRESYNDNRNLTLNYWAVWMAKSVLRDDFDLYDFSVYDVKKHKPDRSWAGTDWGAVILQIVAQGDNPYNYKGFNYVEGMLNYIHQYGEPNWGGFMEPVFLAMALDAAGAMTPSLQESALSVVSSMMNSINSGPDYGGWAMVPVSNYVFNTGDKETYKRNFDNFRNLCLEALVDDALANNAQFGLIGGMPYAGYGAEAGSNAVLIGSVGAMRAGIEDFDLQKGDWIATDTSIFNLGTANIVSKLYDYAFKGKNPPYSQQMSIAFADLYHGSNVWISENPTLSKLDTLLTKAEGFLEDSSAQYSENTLSTLQTAYDEAKNHGETLYNIGKVYFTLQDAIKGLQEANTLSVSVIGNAERQKIITEYAQSASDKTYIQILQSAAVENGMTIITSDQQITEFDELAVSENNGWYVYDGQQRVTDLYTIPADGAAITLKYCIDTGLLEEGATLSEHLVAEAQAALDLGDISAVTEDLELPNAGIFDTAISWMSDKPANMAHDGNIIRGENDVNVRLTAALSEANGASSTKVFTVVVKGIKTGTSTEKAKAYISVEDPKGRTFYSKKDIEIEPGETAYTLLVKTGLDLEVSSHAEYGIYVAAIEGWGEFSDGPNSGWMYRITHQGNTSFPGFSAGYQAVMDDDYVEWIFTRDLGADVGNIWSGGAGTTGAASSETTVAPPATVSNGAASATVSLDDLKTAIGNAKSSGSAILVAPEAVGNIDSMKTDLGKDALSTIAQQTTSDLVVQTPLATVTLPNSVLSEIVAQAAGSTVSIIVESVETSKLTPEQKEKVEDKPVYDISITSGGKNISSFDGKNITVSLPYTLKADEKASDVKVWYLNDAGQLEEMKCAYDEKTGLATFTTNHLSKFMVGVETTIDKAVPTISFTDVSATDWFYDAVKFAVENGLFKGTSESTFSPNEAMTRGMLVSVLHRLAGEPAGYKSSFTDVNENDWFAGPVAWAAANNVVSGYGQGLFGPNDKVTREQIAAILHRYAQSKGYELTKTKDLSGYKDAGSISPWAKEVLAWANAEGLINGRSADLLAPGESATRAEVAAILQRFIENVMK